MQIQVIKIRNTIYEAIDRFYRKNGFYEVAPPVLTPFSCEVACVAGSDLISVNYYDKTTYLSQSTQLYLETLAMEMERVYCINPAFRAESTMLSTHLTEFWMCEAEMTNITFEELIKNTTDLLVEIIQLVLERNMSELNSLGVNIKALEKTASNGFIQLTYTETIEILKNNKVLIEWGDDIETCHKKVLGEIFDNAPLIITLFPQTLSAFYKQTCLENPALTMSFDVIAPNGVGEIVGGSLQENNLDKLKDSLMQDGIDITSFEWYFKMVSEKEIIHGGYGVGVERLVTWICNLKNIQDAIPFPRTEEKLCP